VPLFIDRHDAPGLTPQEVSEAHVLDVAVQEQYGVNYHTYWFDPDAGTVFCLAEGPSKEAVEAVHVHAHGVGAPVVLELDQNAPLNEWFGSVPAVPAGRPYTAPALRIIVFTDLCGSLQQNYELGDDRHVQLVRDHDAVVRSRLDANGGREVKHMGDGIMASFDSVAAALRFAIDVQRDLDARNAVNDVPLLVRIGISAGEPVTDESNDLFGAAVGLAKRLCDSGDSGDVVVSLAVRELCVGKQFRFEDRGTAMLKGIAQPTPMFALCWRDPTDA
jgi:class 3 adenylate cyclase